MQRKRNRKNSKIIVIISILLVLSLSIGYSAFNTNLSINTKGNLKQSVWNFDYTGSEQTFTVPKTGNYKIELWGSSNGKSSYTQNFGGYVSGNIDLRKKIMLYLYIGRSGMDGTSRNVFNYGYQNYIYDGGGSSDVRLADGDWDNFDSLKSRIAVAAGAGSRGGLNPTDGGDPYGGSAGGLKGYKGGTALANNKVAYPGAVGATQTSGHAFGKIPETLDVSCKDKNYCDTWFNATGGNGYFSGYNYDWLKIGYHSSVSGSGGGSSFISGHNGCVAITENSTESNIIQRTDSYGNICSDGTTDITCSYHYSNYIFKDTIMIDGEGYKWTTEKGNYVG